MSSLLFKFLGVCNHIDLHILQHNSCLNIIILMKLHHVTSDCFSWRTWCIYAISISVQINRLGYIHLDSKLEDSWLASQRSCHRSGICVQLSNLYTFLDTWSLGSLWGVFVLYYWGGWSDWGGLDSWCLSMYRRGAYSRSGPITNLEGTGLSIKVGLKFDEAVTNSAMHMFWFLVLKCGGMSG